MLCSVRAVSIIRAYVYICPMILSVQAFIATLTVCSLINSLKRKKIAYFPIKFMSGERIIVWE